MNLALGAIAPDLLSIQASVLRSSAMARCGRYGPELSGKSHIVALRIAAAGHPVLDVGVTGAPNQVVTPGSITVSALRVQLTPDEGLGSLLRPVVTGDVVISRSHADIVCQGGENPPPPPPCQVKDFVADNGEGAGSPDDTISVTTSGYAVSGAVGGNIRLHMPNGCGSTDSGGGKPGKGGK